MPFFRNDMLEVLIYHNIVFNLKGRMVFCPNVMVIPVIVNYILVRIIKMYKVPMIDKEIKIY